MANKQCRYLKKSVIFQQDNAIFHSDKRHNIYYKKWVGSPSTLFLQSRLDYMFGPLKNCLHENIFQHNEEVKEHRIK